MGKRKINLIYFSESYDFGGAEVSLYRLIKGLNKERYSIKFVCPPVGRLGHLIEKLETLGVKVIKLYPITSKFDIRNFYFQYRFFKSEPIDILHFNLPNAYISQYSIVAARLAGVPVIFITYCLPPRRRTTSLRGRLFERLIFYITDKIITKSEAAQKMLLANFPYDSSKVSTIYNGIDLDEFNFILDEREKRKGLNIDQNAQIVGMVGRLTEQKGYRFFLEAVSLIRKELPDVKYIIIGDGPLHNELLELHTSLGVERDVIFVGHRYDVLEIIKIMDVSVLSSIYEGFSNVILEYMAMGRPVVATNVEGVAEAIEDGVTGIIVPPKDPKALAHAIISLLRDKNKAIEIGEKGRERVRKYFTSRVMIGKIEKLYEESLRKKEIKR